MTHRRVHIDRTELLGERLERRCNIADQQPCFNNAHLQIQPSATPDNDQEVKCEKDAKRQDDQSGDSKIGANDHGLSDCALTLR